MTEKKGKRPPAPRQFPKEVRPLILKALSALPDLPSLYACGEFFSTWIPVLEGSALLQDLARRTNMTELDVLEVFALHVNAVLKAGIMDELAREKLEAMAADPQSGLSDEARAVIRSGDYTTSGLPADAIPDEPTNGKDRRPTDGQPPLTWIGPDRGIKQ